MAHGEQKQGVGSVRAIGVTVVLALAIAAAAASSQDESGSPTESSAPKKKPSKPTPPPEPDVVVHESVPAAKRDTARKAFDVLLEECPRLRKGWGEVKTAVARYEKFDPPVKLKGELVHTNYRAQDYGWPSQVIVRVDLAQGADVRGPRASGQTMHFHLGGGDEPGITVGGKAVTRYICTMSGPPGQDVFRGVPALAFVE